MKISELKKEAKVKLAQALPITLGITFTYNLLLELMTYLQNNTLGFLNLIIAIALIILSIPLNYGITAVMLKLFRGENVDFFDFIKLGFKNFKRTISLYISILIKLLIPIILLYAFILLPQLLVKINFSFNNYFIIQKVITVFYFISLIYFFYRILSFVLTTYILVDNPEAQNNEILDISTNLMKGNKLKFVKLLLSFIGWILLAAVIIFLTALINNYLSLFTNIVATILLSAYLSFTIIAFYEDLKEEPKTVENNVE